MVDCDNKVIYFQLLCALLPKRNAGFNLSFFPVNPGSLTLTQGQVNFAKWYIMSGSLIYTLPQKKEPAFHLGKSVT